jgi:hypothetical protein
LKRDDWQTAKRNKQRRFLLRQDVSGEHRLRMIKYGWTFNNWVDNRVEHDYTIPLRTSGFVDFECDNRRRLITERRLVNETANAYDVHIDTSDTPEVLLPTVKYTYRNTGQAPNITVINESVGQPVGQSWPYTPSNCARSDRLMQLSSFRSTAGTNSGSPQQLP